MDKAYTTTVIAKYIKDSLLMAWSKEEEYWSLMTGVIIKESSKMDICTVMELKRVMDKHYADFGRMAIRLRNIYTSFYIIYILI